MTRKLGKKYKAAPESTEMSLSDYARHRGVSPRAVTKAVQEGRLRASVGRRSNGRTFIADSELADREWSSNTQSSARVIADVSDAGVPSISVSRAKAEAARARLLELDVAEREGKVVAVEEIRSEVRGEYGIVRTQILGLPSRVAQRLPHLADEVVPIIDELVREALLELAADGGADEDEDEGEDDR